MKDLVIELKKIFHPAQIVILALLIIFGFFGGNILPRLKNVKAIPQNTINASTTISASDTSYDGDNLTITNGATVTIFGSHSFTNLTINGGILTHDALIPNTDFDITTSELTASGENKKVDLTITGTLTLESGGKIDVDGKGYPGGYAIPNSYGIWNTVRPGFQAFNGFGPGGASTIRSGEGAGDGRDHSGAGGASFRGIGGEGSGSYGDGSIGSPYIAGLPGPTYGNDTDFFAGSGGGGALSYDDGEYSCRSWGGAGGGRVKIVANSIDFGSTSSVISANGKAAVSQNVAGCESSAGGGSGGTIWIEANSIDQSNSLSLNAMNIGVNKDESVSGVPLTIYGRCPGGALIENLVNNGYCPTGVGNEGKITLSDIYIANPPSNINSMGGMADFRGRWEHAIGGIGGGGHIRIQLPAVPPPGPTITTKAVNVTVTWPEGARTEKVDLKTFLRN